MKRTEWIVSVANEGEIGVNESAKWVQELVRCKNCKHYDVDFCKNRKWETSPDWFCGDGIRKEYIKRMR